MSTTERYIANQGKRCPRCDSTKITISDIIHSLAEPLKAARPMTCIACGATWDEIYQLVGVEEEYKSWAEQDSRK